MIKSGQVRALAVTTLKRTAILPDIPTVDELGSRVLKRRHGMAWSRRPARLEDIVATLHRAMVATFKDPGVRQKLAALGVDIVGDTPDEFSAYIASEIPKWAAIIKASGAKME